MANQHPMPRIDTASSSEPEIVWIQELTLGPDVFGELGSMFLRPTFSMLTLKDMLRQAIVVGSSFVMEFKENELESIAMEV